MTLVVATLVVCLVAASRIIRLVVAPGVVCLVVALIVGLVLAESGRV